ncbi:type II secretion system F family protein [Leptospira bourretii]|uniref:General secretion pathway protein F n=1 Tax=Leptospira bourretii TaxID=2484962 RepID=A0A4R9IKK0_9LEPT|nr:type II secretion system F family protein [Leptospira bourretii]TGK84685.1 type II secretion system F family protein [Leptospira bourretii]TGK90453.1 type II secretion system F family protein [Leptospira bourretii]TGL21664.1 type II secretion system F family protein [Leptospira bourretii]TGL27081.1 type II secretion system F family protein [Leptospira bourretii]
MPLYTYVAFNRKGKEEKNIIDAPNLQAARNKLKAKGLYVRSIQEDREKEERELFPFLSKLLYRIPRKEVGLFCKQLGTLLGAGIPLDKCLLSIIDQVENIYFKKVLIEMRADITEGMSLSESMKKHKTVFPDQYPSLISVGESTGNYENTLHRLAELEEKSSELKSKVQVAMIYPMIMGLLSLGVSIFLLVVVIPQIEQLFASFDAKLPLLTRGVIFLSYILTNYWFIILGAIAGGFLSFMKWKSSGEGKKTWDKFLLRLPVIGTLLRKILVSNFARNLSILLLNRVPLIVSLNIVSDVVGHTVFKEEIEAAIIKIKEGGKLSDSLQGSQVLPQMVLGMLSAGEASDKVPEMMNKLSEIYESEVDTAIKSLTQSLEPMMIIVMGGIIFTIMAAIMTPMYKLTQEIQGM